MDFHPAKEYANALHFFHPTHPKAVQPTPYVASVIHEVINGDEETRAYKFSHGWPQIVWSVRQLEAGRKRDVLAIIERCERHTGRAVNDG